jgi:hypothetical protein
MNIDFSDLSKLKNSVSKLTDPLVWMPLSNEPDVESEFDDLVRLVEESKNWGKERNHEKGKLLEKLMGLVLNRFTMANVKSDFSEQDNQIDHELEFLDIYVTNFTKRAGHIAICECKNEKGKIDVSYMAKLIELCESRSATLGFFVSLNGLTGQGWIYADGKRKKNFLRKGIAILHFTFDEIKTLKQNNFYTMFKNKFQNLIAEVDESLDDIVEIRKLEKEEKTPFGNRLINNINEFRKLDLIEECDYVKIIDKIKTIYI